MLQCGFESHPRYHFKVHSAESESKRAETQMQDRVCFEMANIKQMRLEMEEKQESSLSDNDKELVKQAVLESAAKNTNFPPDKLAKSICDAIYLIDSYKH